MPRLQFSIRALLLLMAVVGVSITVFRWPWTVTTADVEKTIVTRYRRNWNGKAVKHGLELTTDKNSSTVQKWYVEGELRRERHESTGGFVLDESFLNGQLDGPYYERSSSIKQECFYRQGKPEGTWTQQYGDLLVTTEWHAGELHGAKTWRTLRGQVLQSAHYDRGRLVAWNGLPVLEALQSWADVRDVDPDVRRNLFDTFTTRAELLHGMSVIRPHREQVYWVGEPPRALVTSPSFANPPEQFPTDRPAGVVLLENALESSGTLAYRFGRVCIVRINSEERDWKDRTCVYGIQFEPGAQEEEFWQGKGDLDIYFALHTESWLKAWLYRGRIRIPFDTTAIEEPEAKNPQRHGHPPSHWPWPAPLPRVRRDAIGEYLDDRGYYCELHDGKLVFKPHPETLLRLQE